MKRTIFNQFRSLKHRNALMLASAWMVVSTTASPPHQAPDLFPVTMHETPDHAPIVLVEDGRPVATICILDVPEQVPGRIQAFRHALDELQTAIELTTGVRLPVVRGEIREPAIILGGHPDAEALGLVGSAMPREGFHIRTAPNRIYIVGHDDPREELDALPGRTAFPLQGTAWGVFEFLERFVGVRWYWSTETYVADFRGIPPFSQPNGRSVQRRSSLVVPPVHLSDQPVFAMRGPEHPWPAHLARLQTAQRLINTHEITITSAVHAPHHWGAFPEIRDHYPEVFELRPDGSRCDRLLCFSNPKTLDVYLNEIARVYDQGEPVDRRRIGISGDAITVSPWDKAPNCQCDDCRPQVQRVRRGRRGFSRIITGFTERLAHAVKERWPDKTVIYLPYQNYMEAPEDGVDFPGNVEIMIAGMGGIGWFKEPEADEYYQEHIDRWHDYTGRKVQTWEYSMYPAHRMRSAPFQFPNVLQTFYRRNRDTLVGSFLNSGLDHRTTRHVTAYVWARLLWNPDIDIEATLDEYAQRMYGDAAAEVREMVAILIDGWEQGRSPTPSTPKPEYLYRPDTHGYTPERMERIRELWHTALRLTADHPVQAGNLAFLTHSFDEFFKEYERIVFGKKARALSIRRVEDIPEIDGRLDDAVWRMSRPVTLRTGGRNPTVYSCTSRSGLYGEGEAIFPTQVHALWTPDHLVIGIRATEPETEALFTFDRPDPEGRPGRTRFNQDAVEILLNPTGPGLDMDWDAIVHIVVNADGKAWEVSAGQRGRFAENMQAAVHVSENEWTVELLLPIEDLLRSHPDAVPPGNGVEWYGQVARMRHQNGKQDGLREQQKINHFYHTILYDSRNVADFAPLSFRP